MELNTLRDLFVDELRDIYNAEQQILRALPQMIQACSDTDLRQALQEHEQQTQGQVERLDQVFQVLGQQPGGKVCRGMEGIVREGQEVLQQRSDPYVRDAGIISAAQRVEHYEMAAYGSVRTYAKQLDEDDCVDLLQQTLDEEGNADKKLTKIAEHHVNKMAEGRQQRAA